MDKLFLIFLFLFSSFFNFIYCEKSEIDNLSLKQFPASFTIVAGGQFQNHVKGTTNDDPNMPNQYETIIESPAIGTFFDNAFCYNFALEFTPKQYNRRFTFGLEFNHTVLKNNLDNTEFLFGEKLSITSLTPYLMIGKFLDKSGIFGKIGFPVKNYQGEYEFAGYYVENNYEKSIALRLGLGLTVELSKGFSLRLSSDIDFGMVNRENVILYYGEQLFADMEPIGDDLQDTQLSINFLLEYKILLNGRK